MPGVPAGSGHEAPRRQEVHQPGDKEAGCAAQSAAPARVPHGYARPRAVRCHSEAQTLGAPRAGVLKV
eukprot:scaffold60800_cov22-Tisochrysis_lutea.AAC.1